MNDTAFFYFEGGFMIIRSEDEWLSLFKKHEVSGLSAAQFCRDEKLCARYFSKRKQQLDWQGEKLSIRPVRPQAKDIPSKDFIQVSVNKSPQNVTLEYGGLKLLMNHLPPSAWLKDLIKSLE